MKSRKLMWMSAIAVLAASSQTAARAQRSNQLPRYAVTDLGTLGGSASVSFALNNKSWVVGNAFLTGDNSINAFLWRDGTTTDLGTLGGTFSAANNLNQQGQIVGNAESSIPDPMSENFCFFGTGLTCLPIVWQDGAMTALPTLGGTNGIAYDINSRGQIAGVAETTTLDSTCFSPEFQSEPVIWERGTVQQLPTFGGDPDGLVFWINNKGQAVGASGDCYTVANSLHALLWQNGKVTHLGGLGGTLFNQADGINDRGQVVGGSNIAGDTGPYAFLAGNVYTHAFIWENGVIRDLGTLPGDTFSLAIIVNHDGQAVGFGSRAIIWQNGSPIDLNTPVPGSPFSPLYLLYAYDINDRGEIVGQGLTSNGDLHAFLAVPCDENHADVASCKDGGVAVADNPVLSAGGNATAPAFRGSTAAFAGRFGRKFAQPVQRFAWRPQTGYPTRPGK